MPSSSERSFARRRSRRREEQLIKHYPTMESLFG
jgi:hypothetical protein